ncbi:MAG: hypothetical protein LC657_08385, partial [Desulfobacteraceae bacterium]|nr:hypothetical protein [Desulfobacteraceae bacterium]
MATRGLKEFGHFSDVTNTRQIREMTDVYLTTMVLEKAQKFDQFFSSIQASAAFVALKAQDAYRHMDTSASVHSKPPHMTLNPENKVFYTPASEPVITAFWADSTISPQISAEI